MARGFSKHFKSAHLKGNTVGTSNEVSFSILDAKMAELDDDADEPVMGGPGLGGIGLFTLNGKRKKATVLLSDDTSSGSLKDSASDTPENSEGKQGTAKRKGLSKRAKGKKEKGEKKKRKAKNAQTVATTQAEKAARPKPKKEKKDKPKKAVGAHAKRGSALAPEDEIAHHKAVRKRRRIVLTVLAFCVVGIGVAMVGSYYFDKFNQHQKYTSDIANAVDFTADTDEGLVAIDNELTVYLDGEASLPISKNEINTIKRQLAGMDELRETLKGSLVMLSRAESEEETPADEQARIYEEETVAARQEMIDCAEEMLTIIMNSGDGVEEAEEAWECLLNADTLIRQAAQLVVSDDADEINEAQKKYEEARVHLEEARTLFDVAAEKTGIPFTAYINYIDKRESAIEHAIASNEALLQRDSELASKENDLYDADENSAASLAATFKDSPVDLIEDQLNNALKEQVSAYKEAREKAGAADAFLRDYLGSIGK